MDLTRFVLLVFVMATSQYLRAGQPVELDTHVTSAVECLAVDLQPPAED